MRLFVTLLIAAALCPVMHAQTADRDGGTSVQLNSIGRGEELLESIYVPPITNAPFSLTLHTEWSRPLPNGGTYTVVNTRPIKRDGAGRIYQERWLLAPKGTDIKSRMSWIQIGDPVAHTLTECSAFRHVCEIRTWNATPLTHYTPSPAAQSGPLPNGKGFRSHEDLNTNDVLGVPVHFYRDTLTLNAGAMGNDQPMTTTREYRYAPDLGFNLTSTLDTPQIGRQVFTITEITRTEPEPKFFAPPAGWQIIDLRKTAP